LNKVTRMSDIWFIHKCSKQVGWTILDFLIAEILQDHFNKHNGTFDVNGKASCQMTQKQIQLCLDDYISEMTRPAKFLFRILT
jgi:hypothetical protein